MLTCALLVAVVRVIFPWAEKQVQISQHLADVRSRFDAAITFQADVLADHVGWTQCGNANYDLPIYTRLYRTNLSLEELDAITFSSPSMGMWLFQVANQVPTLYSCPTYQLFEGYDLMKYDLALHEATYFIVYDFATEIGTIQS